MQRFGEEAAFVSAGGYHHHIGLNTWQSQGRLAAAAGHDRPLPHRDPLPDPARARRRAAPRCARPASRSTAPPTTASARRSTSATPTRTGSSSTGTARRRSGRATRATGGRRDVHRAARPRRPARRARRLDSAPRAAVAQLARASACHAEGRGFESHQPLPIAEPESGLGPVSGRDPLVTQTPQPSTIARTRATLSPSSRAIPAQRLGVELDRLASEVAAAPAACACESAGRRSMSADVVSSKAATPAARRLRGAVSPTRLA